MDAKKAREHLKCWQEAISQNVLTKDHCFQHTTVFNDLKNHPEPLQALMVRDALDSIMILFGAIYLLKEAVHQEKEHACSFKMDCWRYFNVLHLDEETKKDKKLVLEMIEKITSVI